MKKNQHGIISSPLALRDRRHGMVLALGLTVLMGTGGELSQMLLAVREFRFSIWG